MNFDGFYGNAPIKAVLNSHLFHAYLIEGPEGSGKHTLADLITNALVCDGDDPPCGACGQCYKFRQKCHPDITDLDPTLPVEDLRRELASVWLAPNDAKHKVYRIDHAEKLLPAAQNLLLKTLEEPPRDVVFLLLCGTREGVLQTVRSRCQILSLTPLSEEDMAAWFTRKYGTFDKKAKDAAAMAAGYAGKAAEIYESGETQKTDDCRKLDQALRKNDPAEVYGILKFTDREDLTGFYETFTQYARRCLRTGKDTAYYAEICRLADEIAQDIHTNVNVRLWSTNFARLCLDAAKKLR